MANFAYERHFNGKFIYEWNADGSNNSKVICTIFYYSVYMFLYMNDWILILISVHKICMQFCQIYSATSIKIKAINTKTNIYGKPTVQLMIPKAYLI